jgi:hypothetical protein
MVIRFMLRSRRPKASADGHPMKPRLGELRLESHPSGLNRTDARRLSRREIEHRERMLHHLYRTLPDPNSPFPVR